MTSRATADDAGSRRGAWPAGINRRVKCTYTLLNERLGFPVSFVSPQGLKGVSRENSGIISGYMLIQGMSGVDW